MGKKILVSVLIILGTVGMVYAEEPKFLQLALFNPIQMVPEEQSIRGISLDLCYVINKDVAGFSLTLLGVNRVTGDMNGVEWGIGNWVEGSAYGWQSGIVNHAGKRFVGLQGAVVNVTEGDVTGVQMGLVNWAEGYVHGVQAGVVNISKGTSVGANLGLVNSNEGVFKGFQGGIVNYAAEMHGLQLGLVNYTKNLDGIQIGLANYNGNKDPLEFMVFVNWSF